jgi:hypothetical protein
MTREQAVRKLLAEARTTAVTPRAAWTSDSGALAYPRPGPNATEMERKLLQTGEQEAHGSEFGSKACAAVPMNTPV